MDRCGGVERCVERRRERCGEVWRGVWRGETGVERRRERYGKEVERDRDADKRSYPYTPITLLYTLKYPYTPLYTY